MDKLFSKLGDFIVKKSKLNIIVITILTIILGFGVTKLEMKMGNDVFVSSDTDVFKDTAKYQEHFGGDGIYLLLEGDKDTLISQETAAEIVRFTNEVVQIEDITGTTNFVGLMNELLSSDNPSLSIGDEGNEELEEAIKDSISTEDMADIEESMMNSLTDKQKNSIQAFTQEQLKPEQLQELGQQMAALGPNATQEAQADLMNDILTEEQNEAIMSYTESILTEKQKSQMQKEMLAVLPPVEKMSDELLQAIIFSDNGNVPEQLEQLIPANGKHVLIMLNTSNDTEMATYVRINEELNEIIDESHFPEGIKIQAGGVPVVQGDVQGEVITTMGIMLALAVVIMILVLFFVFPVRRRTISLGFVLVGLIWTFGFMGWAGIPITLATMATLPIIIGLGTDFGVQFHNRYEEEFRNSKFNAPRATKEAVRHIGPGVGIAVFIMALSFLTMFLSKAPMMQQFGLTLAIGVVFCYFVELILMFSTFNLLDQRKKDIKIKANDDTWLSRFLGRYAEIVGKFALPILIIAMSLSAIGFINEHKIPTETNLMKMIPQDLEALENTNYLQEVVGSTTFITYLVKAEDVTSPAVIEWTDKFSQKIDDKYEDIQDYTTLSSMLLQLNGNDELPEDEARLKKDISNLPASIKQTLISENNKYATIQFQVNPELASADQLELMNEITDQIDTDGQFKVSPAGAQVMMLYGIDNIGANSKLMIVVGLAIIFTGLFLVYRRVKHSIYPLIPIILVLGFSPLALLLLDMSFNPLTTALSCLVLGIGTEFTILIMERFREEEARGLDAKEAIKVSLSKVGQAITASGLTVVGGFSTLIFVNFPILRDFGITTVIDTLLSLFCALTILPALIVLFRKRKKA
ncbi:RND family transporter [Bacillus sp. V59.32b]|uniref:efflux RND transporter permease subunit n=1 Tax=Bacillus sp. V59.32b TaxID=1758642 RepID=UPI000E3DC5E3|nr:hydrophobe/amphiphile efflux-3 (HAE3) family transporter [Bacillus sp. V59.32b]RFU68553.1 RND family transporter [Bacillus sp. V59.32b]